MLSNPTGFPSPILHHIAHQHICRYGTNQYQSFSKPKKSFGSYLFGSSKKPYGYKTPGHGTSWGTNFAGGVGQWKPKKQGVSKKMLGLGVGAGFLGGAALGVAGTMASYSVYHKYQVGRSFAFFVSANFMTCCRSSRGGCT